MSENIFKSMYLFSGSIWSKWKYIYFAWEAWCTQLFSSVFDFLAFVCPPMCACVCAYMLMPTCVRACVWRRACLSTCMCMYFPRLRSPAYRWREDCVGHRGDGHRCGGSQPGPSSRGIEPQQRGDRSGRHCQHHWAQSCRKQSTLLFSVFLSVCLTWDGLLQITLT